jgi:23S rRNA (cytosine1962-C5)-methyltransferase
VHGDADSTPGLAVDRFGDLVIVHADSDRILASYRAELAHEIGSFSSAYAKVHPPQASRGHDSTLHLWGSEVDQIEALERGVQYAIRPAVGLSVGLFLDMREVRAWLREVCTGRRVLNLFAYTCGFGVCAMLGGATRVLNLDLSRSYLAWGQTNYQLNGLVAHDRDFVYGDAFDWLGRFARRSEQFDVVIVDPPSFSSTRGVPFSVERDYTRLATAAARVVAPGGILLAATNHAGTSEAHFDATLRTALAAAERSYRPQRRWHEPAPDFPVTAGRTPYLKVRALDLE